MYMCMCVIIPIFFNFKIEIWIATYLELSKQYYQISYKMNTFYHPEENGKRRRVGYPGWSECEERRQMLDEFAELARCTCCNRHQMVRPKSLESGWIETPRSTYGNMCECDCRHNMRYMCRVVQGGFIDRE